MPILEWAASVIDPSRLSTFVVSILIIVYGCFRSLNMDQEQKIQERSKSLSITTITWPSEKVQDPETANGKQTISIWQALFMPLGASLSLLIMFLFFDSLQYVFAISTAILAMIAFSFLLLPMCQHLVRQCCNNDKVSCGLFRRFSLAECLAFTLSFLIVSVWVLTGHWLLMDALGMGLCVSLIALVQLPSLKVSTLLLFGLVVYDVFWVFFSSYIFKANVMVRVATRPAENPLGMVAKKLHLFYLSSNVPKLSLPGKLVFPSVRKSGRLSMLGLGDIVMPGLLLCFVLRFDAHKRRQAAAALAAGDESASVPQRYYQRITYFQWCLSGYFLGLLTSTISSEVFQAAQPALLYLVPFTLVPLLTVAFLKGDLKSMWTEPFRNHSLPRLIDV